MTNIQFYNDNAEKYFKNTSELDMKIVYNKFLKYVKSQGSILDLGAGSCRDSYFFSEAGYIVTAIDASSELLKQAINKYGESHFSYKCVRFEDYQADEQYDGIWACASLIHAEREELVGLIHKYVDMLNSGGVMYMTFKLKDSDHVDGMRSFVNFNEIQFGVFLEDLGYDIMDKFVTGDTAGRSDRWVNAIIRKTPRRQ